MSLQTIEFDLPIIPGEMPPVLKMAQYDSGRTFVAHIKNDDGTDFSIGGFATIKIKGMNSAGVIWEQSATYSGSAVTFTPSGAATDQPGKMAATLTITKPSPYERITALEMIFDIQRAGYTNEEAARSQEFEEAIEAAINERIDAVIPLVVTISQNGQTLSSDKTYAQIQAAELSDRPIYAKVPDPPNGRAQYAFDDNGAAFHVIDTTGGGALFEYLITENGVSKTTIQL